MNRFIEKTGFFLAISLLTGAVLTGCETVIPVTLDSGPTQLAVEATVYNTAAKQSIRLTQSVPYFSNAPAPPVTGATVVLLNDAGRAFAFTDPDNDGSYDWNATNARDSVGVVGQRFVLTINYQTDTYRATSMLNRVPPIDSLIFRDAKINPVATVRGYRAEFYATDYPGAVDYYRIQYARNGRLQNGTADITTVYNGSIFGGSSNTDGGLFIRPGRQAINPDSLYALGDVVTVRLSSITAEHFYFLGELSTQLNNQGQFAEPATNLSTNIVNTTSSSRPAVGFFVTSAVRTLTRRVGEPYLRPALE
jgi:hypothetical protein